MSKELKSCPFCGGTRSISVLNFFTRDTFRKCDICGAEAPEAKTPEEAVEKWNTRPAEDALKAEVERLKAENAELRYIVEQFFDDWYCEDGCPKQKDKKFPCSGEEENETTAEFYPGECSFYQTKCWVEFYRWQFWQKNNTPDTEKGGEDE